MKDLEHEGSVLVKVYASIGEFAEGPLLLELCSGQCGQLSTCDSPLF